MAPENQDENSRELWMNLKFILQVDQSLIRAIFFKELEERLKISNRPNLRSSLKRRDLLRNLIPFEAELLFPCERDCFVG